MLLHLRVDEQGDRLLVAAQHLARVIFREVSLEVLDHLCGQVIQQVGMIVIRNVIEIHQAADHVVLKPRFLDAAPPHRQDFQLIRAAGAGSTALPTPAGSAAHPAPA